MSEDDRRRRKTGELAQVYVLNALRTHGKLRITDLPELVPDLSPYAARTSIKALHSEQHVTPVPGKRGHWQITEQGLAALRRQQRHIDDPNPHRPGLKGADVEGHSRSRPQR